MLIEKVVNFVKIKGKYKAVLKDNSTKHGSGVCDISNIGELRFLKAEGNVQSKHLDIDEIVLKGKIYIASVKAKNIKLVGNIKSDEVLADSLRCEFSGVSSIKHIKVSKVDIHPECHKNSEVVSGLFERFLGKKIAFSDDNMLNIFKANIIKSDYVKVSNAEIGFISGKNVVVGEGCKISHIEYTDSLDVSHSAVVGKIVSKKSD